MDFLPWLICTLTSILGHACFQLLVLANYLDHCSTYGVVGLMRVVGCFMQPCGGCLHLSWLVELKETMAICAPCLSFADLPHAKLGATNLSCDSRSLNKILCHNEFCLNLDLLTTLVVHFHVVVELVVFRISVVRVAL